MYLKDWGTLFIAVLALFLSSLNTYYQFYYERHDVKAAIFNFGINQSPDDPQIDIRAQADMVLKNNGTFHEVVSGVRFFYSGCENSPHGFETLSLMKPIILKPGEKRMVSLRDKFNPSSINVLTTIHPNDEEKPSLEICEENLKSGKVFVKIEIEFIQLTGFPLVIKSKSIPIKKVLDPIAGLEGTYFSKPDLVFDLINNQVITPQSK